MADLVESLIKGSRVMVFSKSYCPYCTKAKSALQSVGLTQYGLLELDGHPRCDEARAAASPRAPRAHSRLRRARGPLAADGGA
jgi:hypothetical protein